MPTIVDQFHSLEQILLHDPGNRGVAHLACPGDLLLACRALLDARRVAIVTGFYIRSAGAHETDGPPGAVAVGKALESLGKHVCYATDALCVPILQAVVKAPIMEWSTVNATALDGFDVLLSIERCGRAADGLYHNMRGLDISEWTAPWDEAFLKPRQGQITIGVGDGGNEVGMGKVADRVRSCINNGPTIACIVPVDALVTAGVSNWGGWGLVAGMSLLAGKSLLPTEEQAFADLDAMVVAGAVDGVTGRKEPTVDGLSWGENARILELLRGKL